jgi:UDP-glucose 4-epimerase
MQELKDKVVVVAGGCGFIGSHLVDEILKHEPKSISVIDNLTTGKYENGDHWGDKVSLVGADISDLNKLREIISNHGKPIDVLFNCAVVPLPHSLIEPFDNVMMNTLSVTAVCEAAREGIVKTVIHFSSSEAYGSAKYEPMDEEHPLGPSTPYAASKAAGDLVVGSYIKTFGIDAAIIRPFNNYGPRQNAGTYAGIIPLTIDRFLRGEPAVIQGDGKQTRDYTYVTDTARAAVDIYRNETTRGRVINIGCGRDLSVFVLIVMLAEVMGVKKTGMVRYEPARPGDVRRHLANRFLAQDLINYAPKVSMMDGLKATVEWYRKIMEGKA